MMNDRVGYVIGGSLKDSLRIRITDPNQQVREGSFVVIQSGTIRYYGLITNIILCASDARFADERTLHRFPEAIREKLRRQTLYKEVDVLPSLMQDVGPEPGDTLEWSGTPDPNPLPVNMIPDQQDPVRMANSFDVAEVFGKPDDPKNFWIGSTREQGHPVCISMEKFVQRSSGIFGATGTGKSYLTRMILAGLIRSGQASALIFDMHNEYAFDSISPDSKQRAIGLKSKFGSKVRVCSLGGGRISGQQPDFDLVLARSDITTTDILMASRELHLRETSASTLAALEKDFGDQWLKTFMEMPTGTDDENCIEAWAKRNHLSDIAATTLRGRLQRLNDRDYLCDKVPKNAVDQIIDALKSGASVVLSFGKYEQDLDYLLVTNILTRKVREEWVRQTDAWYRDPVLTPQPKPLVIAVEEAHILLNPEMSDQTAFSTIAREMRKYFVTLLVIDQRPSGIDDEVMSQLGTRISGWLGDDADIAAVLSGLAGRDALRGMLARLQPKQEVLLLGYGVPMPLPIRSRRYDEEFWAQLLGPSFRPSVPTLDDDWLVN